MIRSRRRGRPPERGRTVDDYGDDNGLRPARNTALARASEHSVVGGWSRRAPCTHASLMLRWPRGRGRATGGRAGMLRWPPAERGASRGPRHAGGVGVRATGTDGAPGEAIWSAAGLRREKGVVDPSGAEESTSTYIMMRG